jgi:DNA-directed RNA polymerase subunit alpha
VAVCNYSPGRLKLRWADSVDAICAPVRKVNYNVSRTYQPPRTTIAWLEIWTDGTVAPESALRESARLLVRHLTLVAGADVVPPEQATAEGRGVPSRIYDVPIEELELSVRAYNCLKRAGITKVGEVLERLEKGEEEVLAIRNFGRKSLNELVDRLDQKGYLSAISYQPSATAELDEDAEDADTELA